MKTCTCGAKMYRHKRNTLKTTQEECQKFICTVCKRIESYYKKPGDTSWTPENRGRGSHARKDDGEFVWN